MPRKSPPRLIIVTSILLTLTIIAAAAGANAAGFFSTEAGKEYTDPPVTVTGSPESPTGILLTARYLHTATMLPNGKVLAVGGLGAGSDLSSTEFYYPGNEA